MMYQGGFFEIEDCYARLDKAGDPLASLDAMVNWHGLSLIMDGVSLEVKNNGGKGGRPPLSGLLMAKILILQACNNLADDRAEFLINDRLSFKRFLGLGVNDKSPDAKTIWLWRERVKHGGLHEKIFAWFEGELCKAGYAAKGGQIVDATFVPTHQPAGKYKKQLAQEIPLSARQSEQIDPDATFTKKRNESHHGYKNHVRIDARHKLIRAAETTTASLHDSQKFEDMLAPASAQPEAEENAVYADSAYRSTETEANLAAAGLNSQVHERAYKNKPLTPEQKAKNREKSRIRVRVEHMFGHMNTAMHGLMIHTIGLARAKVKVTFKNLAYNMQRFAFLMRQRQQHQCA
jgi:IS5 family transposase